ncbi:MAG: FecR domain-containing protein [Pseudomonadota bacterium]
MTVKPEHHEGKESLWSQAVDLWQAYEAGQVSATDIDAFRSCSSDHRAAIESAERYLRAARSIPRRNKSLLWNSRYRLQLWAARLTQPGLALGTLAIVAALSSAWLFSTGDQRPTPVPVVASATTESQLHETAWRDREEVLLQDGSRMWLDWRSSAKSSFNDESRRISVLRGTAAFKVVPDSSRPFLVEANELVIRVTGTEFTVNLDDQDQIGVEVLEGTVHVRLHDTEAVLEAEQRLEATSDALGPVLQSSANEMGRWREGMLVFDQRPLVDAIRALGQYLPYRIDTRDLVNGEREVTGVYFTEEAEKGLHALIQSHRLKATSDGRTLRLQERPPERPRF